MFTFTREQRWPYFLVAGAMAISYSYFISSTAFEFNGRMSFTLFDDAMISMTYARNLARGDGLVWFAGQPPTEGYTNFLWTLWMAVLHLFPVGDRQVSLLVMISGAILLFLTAHRTKKIADEIGAPPWVASAAFLLVGINYGLAFWTLRGMEVGLIGWLIAVMIHLSMGLAKRPASTNLFAVGLTVCALLLTRTDTAVPIGAVLIWLAWRLESPAKGKTILILAGVAALTLVGHTLFRLAYYGEVFPNTYYLKLGGVSLVIRLQRGMEHLMGSVVVLTPLWLPAALASVQYGKRYLRPEIVLLLAVVGSAAGYSVYIGADAWEWMPYVNRYLSVAIPPLTLAGLLGADTLFGRHGESRPKWKLHLLLLSALAGLLVYQHTQHAYWNPYKRLFQTNPASLGLIFSIFLIALLSWTSKSAGRGYRAVIVFAMLISLNLSPLLGFLRTGPVHATSDARWARIGMVIREQSDPDIRVAVVWAGAIPYFSERQCIDILGKADSVIANLPPRGSFIPGHNKWDYDYSIGELQPDLIQRTWIATKPDLEKLYGEWGYRKLKNGMIVKKSSERKMNVARIGKVR